MSIQNSLDAVIQSANEYVEFEKSLAEYNALSEVITDFDQHGLSEFKSLQAVHSLLEARGISVDLPVTDVERLSSVANELMVAFSDQPTAQSLKAERRLTSTFRVLKKLVTSYRLGVDNAYKEFIRLQYGNIGLRDLNVSAAKTPKNSQLLDLFRIEYENFNSIVKIRPIKNELLDSIQNSGNKLTNIYKKIDFNIPDDVKRFFDGIESGGASLSLLSDSVVKYLEENNMLTEFKIIKTGISMDH